MSCFTGATITESVSVENKIVVAEYGGGGFDLEISKDSGSRRNQSGCVRGAIRVGINRLCHRECGTSARRGWLQKMN